MTTRALCRFCGQPIDPDSPWTYEKTRVLRDVQTGEVVLEERLPIEERDYVHSRCMAKKTRGISIVND